MVFVKIVKNNAYYKRFQTKFRRRREGKTDYYSRSRMIVQDKDKYNSPKYRFVARRTNTKIICQIIYATIKGDRVICSADSKELRNFGLTAGLSSYPAAYCTGFLCARRLLKGYKMDTIYPPTKAIDGKKYDVSELNVDRRPFKAYLDFGLARATKGNRIFGALKGVTDGGLYVPHDIKKFPGYTFSKEDDDGGKYDPKVHRDKIFGVNIDKYMQLLKKEGPEAYNKQFSNWKKCLDANKLDSVEKVFQKIHEAILKNPERVKKPKKVNPDRKKQQNFRHKRLTNVQRKAKIAKKFEIARKKKGLL